MFALEAYFFYQFYWLRNMIFFFFFFNSNISQIHLYFKAMSPKPLNDHFLMHSLHDNEWMNEWKPHLSLCLPLWMISSQCMHGATVAEWTSDSVLSLTVIRQIGVRTLSMTRCQFLFLFFGSSVGRIIKHRRKLHYALICFASTDKQKRSDMERLSVAVSFYR